MIILRGLGSNLIITQGYGSLKAVVLDWILSTEVTPVTWLTLQNISDIWNLAQEANGSWIGINFVDGEWLAIKIATNDWVTEQIAAVSFESLSDITESSWLIGLGVTKNWVISQQSMTDSFNISLPVTGNWTES